MDTQRLNLLSYFESLCRQPTINNHGMPANSKDSVPDNEVVVLRSQIRQLTTELQQLRGDITSSESENSSPNHQPVGRQQFTSSGSLSQSQLSPAALQNLHSLEAAGILRQANNVNGADSNGPSSSLRRCSMINESSSTSQNGSVVMPTNRSQLQRTHVSMSHDALYDAVQNLQRPTLKQHQTYSRPMVFAPDGSECAKPPLPPRTYRLPLVTNDSTSGHNHNTHNQPAPVKPSRTYTEQPFLPGHQQVVQKRVVLSGHSDEFEQSTGTSAHHTWRQQPLNQTNRSQSTAVLPTSQQYEQSPPNQSLSTKRKLPSLSTVVQYNNNKFANLNNLNNEGSSNVMNLTHRLCEPLTEQSLITQIQRAFQSGVYWFDLGPVSLFLNSFTNDDDSFENVPAPNYGVLRLSNEIALSLRESDAPQAVVFCGDSGSGKSWLSRQLVQQLYVTIGSSTVLQSDSYQIVESSFDVLRALCHAPTLVNRHASRVTTLCEIFVVEGQPARTRFSCCFTDHARLLAPDNNTDGNYEIFHYMINGLQPEEKTKFHLSQLDSDLDSPSGGHDSMEQFLRFRQALDILGIPFSDVMRLLSSVLLLRKVNFDDSNSIGGELDIQGQNELESVAALLGLSGLTLYRALTQRTRLVKDQHVRTGVSALTANIGKDNLARTLYQRCVAAILRRINIIQNNSSQQMGQQQSFPMNGGGSSNGGQSSSDGEGSVQDSGICMASSSNKSPTSPSSSILNADGVIAVLDAFGFSDSLQTNKFESFCVNLCHEKLMEFYRSEIFAKTQQLMHQEDITEHHVSDLPMRSVCGTILIAPQTNFIDLLAKETDKTNNSSVPNFLRSIHENSGKYHGLVQYEFREGINDRDSQTSNSSRTAQYSFLVTHFADTAATNVSYDAQDFLTMNRNQLDQDLVQLFARRYCNFGFVAHLFASDLHNATADEVNGAKVVNTAATVPMKRSPQFNTAIKPTTFAEDLFTQFDQLLSNVQSARKRFVHCVRTNNSNEPMIFDVDVIKSQLKRLDVLPTARLCVSGLPYALRLDEFNQQYRFLLAQYHAGRAPLLSGEKSEEARLILECYLRAVDDSNLPYISNHWAVGSEHVLLSQGAFIQLQTFKLQTTSTVAVASATQLPLPPTELTAANLNANNNRFRHRQHSNQNMTQSTTNLATHSLLPKNGVNHHGSVQQLNSPVVRSSSRTSATQSPRNQPAQVQHSHAQQSVQPPPPPPLPPHRLYKIYNGRKLQFPQRRVVVEAFKDSSGLRFLPGDVVSVVGFGGPQERDVLVSIGNNRSAALPAAITRVCLK